MAVNTYDRACICETQNKSEMCGLINDSQIIEICIQYAAMYPIKLIDFKVIINYSNNTLIENS